MRLFWAEKALPFMLIVLGGLFAISSIFFPSVGSVEIDVSELLPEEIEIPIASYSFNITVDSPLIGKVVIPVKVGGSRVAIRLSEAISEQKIEISISKLSYVLIAIRILLVVLGITLFVAGLAVRSILV